MSTVNHEGHAPVESMTMYYRDIGQGQPIIIAHGGPDFDHTYLLPDMDRLSEVARLIYYDQRGRGRSSGEVDEVSMAQEVADLDGLRQHLGFGTVAVMGHSWGGLVALAYALRHPERVSHLILMGSVPASREDWQQVRQEVGSRMAPHEDRLTALRESAAYQAGDLAAVHAYYQVWFSVAFKQPENLGRLNVSFSNFTPDIILRARAIEERLYDETIKQPDFDLIPALKHLRVPTLIVHGDYDWIPPAAIAPIAAAIPGARMVVLPDCGHFAYIEAPDAVRAAIDTLMG
jgi:proline iminopeptidase